MCRYDRATAIGNMHNEFGKDGTRSSRDMTADRQTHTERETDRQTDTLITILHAPHQGCSNNPANIYTHLFIVAVVKTGLAILALKSSATQPHCNEFFFLLPKLFTVVSARALIDAVVGRVICTTHPTAHHHHPLLLY